VSRRLLLLALGASLGVAGASAGAARARLGGTLAIGLSGLPVPAPGALADAPEAASARALVALPLCRLEAGAVPVLAAARRRTGSGAGEVVISPLAGARFPDGTALAAHDIARGWRALAAAGGVLLAPSLYLYPTVGELLVVKCFVIVVLGGLGSVPGAIAGGVLLGLVESLGAVYVSSTYKDGIGFVLFLAVLLYRPQGIFGVGRS